MSKRAYTKFLEEREDVLAMVLPRGLPVTPTPARCVTATQIDTMRRVYEQTQSLERAYAAARALEQPSEAEFRENWR